ncbi:MAG: dTMP kinase [Candidatus Levybacteria bacterium RIFCSPHIGHO2_02_FULL_40_18]|nr:MAG: dTMP kinase [Candidatus Levybacteria bacterium RIFCSPHIGHO2_01_FULL_40_58]OGH26672.1 MAG: dTMP kinase [Candidatus Levybacteria bacterium RIFCSPHIGHO2_02_FULL_40_18]OGH31607.1 MAG: dTMP kinase [Candidatus Levybacteria bacterium RIFCSPHIGHO2_12_FULL_40_31]OGH40235.1 MAG: dTMP kinase [Candidatus Levybacteria bacterium RIFCSPLOWO2_01_FULL_40_64]OGH49475.1 MAG: dTMP kinase [Candidatus Levybacteria bacterium RIFCSPLOWO2_02_FULL_41_11]OGH53226.1 MAG: dTMP kinase [Candidatus Levybacteria bacte
MKHKVSFELELKKHDYPGKFIVLEGIDAAGKTTHSFELVDKLKREGHKTVYTKEPTDGEIGRLIRQVLVENIKVPPVALQYLFCADRAVHQEKIISYLKKGHTVISDRYFWSAVAYGIADLSGVMDYYLTVYSVLSFYNQFISPDFTFFLDVEVDEAVRRIKKSHEHREIYDDRDKIIKIKDSYEKLINMFPEEFIVINANKPIDAVSKELLEQMRRKI